MLLGQSHPSFEHVLPAPSLGRIAACGGSLVVRSVKQVVRVVLSHPLVEPPQGFTAQPLLAFSVRLRLLVEVHAVLLSQSAHSVDECHALALHQVRDDIPALLASPEAVPRLPGRVDVEARGLLGVEWAASHPFHPALFQLHTALLYDAHNVRPLKHGLYGRFRNHDNRCC